MWASAGTGRWSSAEGYLLSNGDVMLELHGDTLHTYRLDPKADKLTFVGSPLDGYTWQSTDPTCQVAPAMAPVDATAAWTFLGDRAELVAQSTPAPADPIL